MDLQCALFGVIEFHLISQSWSQRLDTLLKHLVSTSTEHNACNDHNTVQLLDVQVAFFISSCPVPVWQQRHQSVVSSDHLLAGLQTPSTITVLTSWSSFILQTASLASSSLLLCNVFLILLFTILSLCPSNNLLKLCTKQNNNTSQIMECMNFILRVVWTSYLTSCASS